MLENELKGMDEELSEEVLCEVGEHRLVCSVNSGLLWKRPGGVTGATAAKIVFDNDCKCAEKTAQKEVHQREKEAADVQCRQEAAPMIEQLKTIVRAKGWETGGRGGLTGTMLLDVLMFLNTPARGGEKVADLDEHVKQKLGWTAEGCFPGNHQPVPAAPPPSE